jgi:DNA transformation protein
MAKANPFVDFVVEQMESMGEIHARAMFGGHGLYCDGVFFALISRGAVFLKVDDVNRPAFEALRQKPFRPWDDKPDTMQYYEAPAEMFEDGDILKEFVGGAVAAGRRAQENKKKPAAATKRKRA